MESWFIVNTSQSTNSGSTNTWSYPLRNKRARWSAEAHLLMQLAEEDVPGTSWEEPGLCIVGDGRRRPKRTADFHFPASRNRGIKEGSEASM